METLLVKGITFPDYYRLWADRVGELVVWALKLTEPERDKVCETLGIIGGGNLVLDAARIAGVINPLLSDWDPKGPNIKQVYGDWPANWRGDPALLVNGYGCAGLTKLGGTKVRVWVRARVELGNLGIPLVDDVRWRKARDGCLWCDVGENMALSLLCTTMERLWAMVVPTFVWKEPVWSWERLVMARRGLLFRVSYLDLFRYFVLLGGGGRMPSREDCADAIMRMEGFYPSAARSQ